MTISDARGAGARVVALARSPRTIQVAAGLCVAALGVRVFMMPAESHVMVFRLVWVGFIPLPIPLGFFTSPRFWGGLLTLAGAALALAGFRSGRR